MPPAATQDVRVGQTFYPDDVVALNRLVSALRTKGLRVKKPYLLRAMAHFVGADEMFAYALTRNRAEQAGKAVSAGELDHVAVNLIVADLDKMEGVGDQLSDKRLRGGRSFIFRSLIHAPWNLDHLAREVKKFQAKYPDLRTRAGREKRGD